MLNIALLFYIRSKVRTGGDFRYNHLVPNVIFRVVTFGVKKTDEI